MRTKRSSAANSGLRPLFIFLFVISSLVACSKQPIYPEPSLQGSEVVIDAGDLRSGGPVFFTFHYHGNQINFFVLRVNEKVLSFLDACTSCYPSNRGYRIDNGYLTCRKCDVRYSLSDIEKGFGTCSPISLEGRLQGGKYLIPVSVLEKAINKPT